MNTMTGDVGREAVSLLSLHSNPRGNEQRPRRHNAGMRLALLALPLALAACFPPMPPGPDEGSEVVGDGDGEAEAETSGDGDGETTTEPQMDMGDPETGDGDGDGDPDPGWCCECGTDPMDCTPSSESECTAENTAWCHLDAEGNPSDCDLACEMMQPAGWCCECASFDAPVWSCHPATQQECAALGMGLGEPYEWCELDGEGQPSQCAQQCASAEQQCCSCADANCWPLDDGGCDAEGEVLCDPGQDPQECLQQCW